MVIAIFCCSFRTFLVSQTLLHRAMLSDERVYPDPHEFKPKRFLKDGKLETVRLETRWTLHLGSVGGEHHIISLCVY